MKIAFIDDLKQDLDALYQCTSHYCQLHNIPLEPFFFDSGEAFLSKHTANRFDMIFMDIYMKQMTGMDVAKKIRAMGDESTLIFITTSTDYAVTSYDVDAAYYLLKPVDEQKLSQVLAKCMKRSTPSKSIDVMVDRFPMEIPLPNILYTDTFQNAIHIHTSAGTFKTYLTFQKFTELLEGDPRFLNCYKGCMVNMDHIRSSTQDCFVIDNGDLLPIRKREINSIKRQYTNYLLNNMK